MTITIRNAARQDLDIIYRFICDLADYENLRHEVHATPEGLAERLFGPRTYAEVVIAETDGTAQGFALFFHNFSSFEGKPGLYLEDLFVRPEARGRGIGKALLVHLAQMAIERDCARMEWTVLDWNEPSIAFYRSIGARPKQEWIIQRLQGDALADLASKASGLPEIAGDS